MEHIDLVSLLKAYNPKAVEKCIVYGRAVKVVDKPDNIFDTVKISETGVFVEVQCFAVNLGYHASFLRDNGVSNRSNIYMVNGSIITFVESGIELPDWYAFKGSLRFGTKNLSNTYVGLLTYFKGSDGWEIKPSSVSDIEMDLFDSTSKAYDYLNRSFESDRVIVPSEVLAMTNFSYKVDNYKPNTAETKGKSGVVKHFNKESRKECKEPSDNLKKLQDKLDIAKSLQTKFLDSIVSKYRDKDISAIKVILDNLLSNLKSKPVPQASTGRSLIKAYLSNFKGSGNKYLGSQTIAEVLADSFDDVRAYVLDNKHYVPVDGDAWDICKAAFADDETMYIGITSAITGVSFNDLLNAKGVCSRSGMSIVTVLNKNPYLLQFLCSISFQDIERLAQCFGVAKDKSLDMYRNLAILDNYIITNDSSTLYTKAGLSSAKLGITITANNFEALKNYGNYLPASVRCDARHYLGTIRNDEVSCTVPGFVRCYGNKYVKQMSLNELLDTISNYDKVGLGVSYENYVTSYTLLRQELYVFETMLELGNKRFDYDTEQINKYIKEYEDIIGFSLEKEQLEAVHLIVNGGFVIAGSAGSGKTTVSRCIIYVLEKLESTLELRFAAPTGKAAKHMQEVIKRPVKTLHSEFKVGISQEEDSSIDRSNIAYFIDEGAMISLSLLYSVLRHIDTKSCRVYMFGDFCQLPPIGKGLPFKNLLRFMPCVFLNVSKRAAEGSEITRNSNYINERSDIGNWVSLESSGDFRLLPCKGSDINGFVYDICAYYLGRKPESEMYHVLNALGVSSMPVIDVEPDDIQVVTPLSKSSYSWGAISLNKLLKPLFNPVRRYDSNFVYQLTEKVEGTLFSIGDRVIHTEKNMYNMQWYVDEGCGVFRKVFGYGICNGEVGKVVGFYETDGVVIEDELGDEPEDFQYPDRLRDDTSYTGENRYFVAVQYYDYVGERNIVILYRATVNVYISSNSGIVLNGDDLARLNLFYAGTTHKLQGSEAKLVIYALDSVNYSGFITREMVYTMVTRARGLDMGVGSVSSDTGSMLSRARRDLASSDTFTVGEILV